MALSRKYYKMIARCIKVSEVKFHGVNKSMINKNNLIDALSDVLKRDNINFNYTTFKDACE